MQKQCTDGGFNYCKWAKAIIAIPVFPLIALVAASFFSELWMQFIAGFAAIAVAIYAAILIDRIPFLKKQISSRRCL